MKTKKFRAATMREALEQVKQEMGENALVIDTRRVRERGFLGFGASELIEVRAAANAEEPEPAPGRQLNENTPASDVILRLSEASQSTAAAKPAQPETASPEAYVALAARAAAGNARATAAVQAAGSDESQSDGHVEIANSAPRIVHRRQPGATLHSVIAERETHRSETRAEDYNLFRGEIDGIRQELREVKFSLGAFASRPVSIEGAASGALAAFEEDPSIYDSPFYEAYLELTAAGLAPAQARRAIQLARSAVQVARTSSDIARDGLAALVESVVGFAPDPIETLTSATSAHAQIAFIGPTGVGKTTTIAKLAARLALKLRRRVELITLDTYRIAAVEQLKTYAEIIGAGCHVARSVVELNALSRRYENQATVLIDTIGRSPQDLADQIELADYFRSCAELAKCLVLPATTHPVDAGIAVRKFALFGADHLVITKLDETARPGASVRVASESGLPLLYLCAGQRVPEDIELATPASFSSRIIRSGNLAAAA